MFVTRALLLNLVVAVFHHAYAAARERDELDPEPTDLDRSEPGPACLTAVLTAVWPLFDIW